MIHLVRTIGLPILLGFIFFGAYVANHLGIWKPVSVELSELSPSQIIFREHLGAYHKIDPVLSEIEQWAKGQGLSCHHTFAEFLDDPNTTAEVDLRARVGCLWPIQSGEIEKIQSVLLEAGMSRETVAGGHALIARFTGAPSIAPMKVYPKLNETLSQKRLKARGPMTHIYRQQSDGSLVTEYQQLVETPPQ